VVQAMEGYKPAAKGIRYYRSMHDGPQYGDELHKLIDQTVFQKFRFVSRAI
jgi:hypothetical protein